MSLDACLPLELQGPSTTITRIAAGLSGAGVYRVESAGQAFVLKVSDPDMPLAGWRSRLRIQQLASDAGLAPRIVHADETRRAVVSAFVVDRSYPALYMNPATREAALLLLGRTLRRVHDLPLPPDAVSGNPLELLRSLWSGLAAERALPPFVDVAVGRVLTEQPPPVERAPVLSHNDVNPSNLSYDGEQLQLIDWNVAGPNDPLYDLAAIAVFLRMDDDTCERLLAAHDGAPVTALPERFLYLRRLVAALCGTMFLELARRSGFTGAAETLESAPSLADFYQRLRAGMVNVATGEGKWAFGLALVKHSVALGLTIFVLAAAPACTGTTKAPARQEAAMHTPAPPPAWMQGVWTREWIERNGRRSSLFAVHYLQTPSLFGDMRIPVSRPAFPHAASFADLSDTDLQALARQRGFTGPVTALGDTITWHHEIDFQPVDGGVDAGRVEHTGPGRMYEHALDSSYVESWVSVAPADSAFLVIRVERGDRLEKILLVSGDHFLYVRNRAADLPAAESLDSLIRTPGITRDRIIAYLDCEFSSGLVRGGSVPWEVQVSTLPWLERHHLAFADSVTASADSSGLQVRVAAVERWSVPLNTLSRSVLEALFPGHQ